MSQKITVDAAVAIMDKVLASETVGKYLCGVYTDGTVRSIPDAISGEMKSPKQKRKEEKKKQAKKGKKDNKKKKKKMKKHVDMWTF